MRVLTPKSQRLEGAQLRCAGAYRGRPRAAPRNARQLRASADGWRRAVHHGRAHPRGRPCAERRRPCNECSVAAACVPMSTRAARLPLGAPRLITRLAPALAAGPFPPVRRGPSARATPRRPGWMQRIGTARRAKVQRVGDRRAPCAAVEGHRLKVRCGHVSATASGRIWQRPPGQLVTAWPAFGARRMQQAVIGADSCAARARPCRDHAPQESRRTRGHPSAWSAALPSWSLGLRFQGNWIRRGGTVGTLRGCAGGLRAD